MKCAISNCNKPRLKGQIYCKSHCSEEELVPAQAVKCEFAMDTTIARDSIYGPFEIHAQAEQAIKAAMVSQPGWLLLNDVQKSALEMIVHKMARILNSSADYDDNWHDVAGYASLAERDIHKRLKS